MLCCYHMARAYSGVTTLWHARPPHSESRARVTPITEKVALLWPERHELIAPAVWNAQPTRRCRVRCSARDGISRCTAGFARSRRQACSKHAHCSMTLSIQPCGMHDPRRCRAPTVECAHCSMAWYLGQVACTAHRRRCRVRMQRAWYVTLRYRRSSQPPSSVPIA